MLDKMSHNKKALCEDINLKMKNLQKNKFTEWRRRIFSQKRYLTIYIKLVKDEFKHYVYWILLSISEI